MVRPGLWHCPAVAAPADRALSRWFVALWVGVGCMLLIGGITRLTGSGLSITEWKPVTGALPPLGAAAWADEFARYLDSPQGRLVNDWMALADFKRIYFWEWLHRLAGRGLGLLVAIPWAWFVLRRKVRGRLALAVLGVFLLGAAQGLMGWLMVASGLVDRPQVSHLRLAAHLSLALLLSLAVLRLVLSQRDRPALGSRLLHRLGGVLVLAVLLQAALGAFVAGTHAGLIYPTWPGFGGAWPPPEALSLRPLWENLFLNPAGMHFAHRTTAWAVASGVLLWSVLAWREGQRRLPVLLGVLIAAQIGLGIATVLLRVPVGVAAAHQFCAWLLLSALATATWATNPGAPPCPTDSRRSSSPSASRASSPSASPPAHSGKSAWPPPAGTSSPSTPATS